MTEPELAEGFVSDLAVTQEVAQLVEELHLRWAVADLRLREHTSAPAASRLPGAEQHWTLTRDDEGHGGALRGVFAPEDGDPIEFCEQRYAICMLHPSRSPLEFLVRHELRDGVVRPVLALESKTE